MVLLQFGFVTVAGASIPGAYLSTLNHNLLPGRYRVNVFEAFISSTSASGTNNLYRLDFLSGIKRENNAFLPPLDTYNSTIVNSSDTSTTVYLPPNSILIPNIATAQGNRDMFEFNATLTGSEIQIQILLGTEKPGSSTSAMARMVIGLIGLEMTPL